MSNSKHRSNLSPSQQKKLNLNIIGGAMLIILAGIGGILTLDSAQSSLDLHDTPSCTSSYDPYTLDWSNLSWSNGELSKTLINVDGSGVNFSFTYSGHTNKFGSLGTGKTPNIQQFFPSESIDALSHYVSRGFSGNQDITITIDINPAIPATVAFDLYHVNGSSYSGDKLSIYAEPAAGGAHIYPTFNDNGSPSWEDEGNGVVDAIGSSTYSNNAYVGVNFDNPTLINKIILVWTECDLCGGNEHGFGMGNMEFCAAPTDTDDDGVPDLTDIDDDDDGIPDIEEICGLNASSSGIISVEIQLDGYASEVSWILKNSANVTVLSNSYGSGNNNSFVQSDYTATPGTYTFEILDSWGDGLCCNNQGYYQIKVDGSIVAGPITGNYGSSSTQSIVVGGRSMGCVAGDPSLDSDNDGIINYEDPDFCSLNGAGVCSSLDKDGDGIPDYLDLDADNDGIPDIVEAGGADDDGNGRVDNPIDSDQDGLANVFETNEGSTSRLLDSNGDGDNDISRDPDQDNQVSWLDLDSDGDGIVDVREAGGTDSNQDGIIDSYATDIDNDGYGDTVDGDVGNDGSAENTSNSLLVTSSDINSDGIPDSGYPNANADGDGNPDFLDIDADDDGIVDNTEAQSTASYQAPSGNDADGDGIDDTYDNDDSNFGGSGLTPENTDNNGEADYVDTDSDDDTLLDNIEGHDANGDGNPDSKSPANSGQASGVDTDGDGLDDGYDNNTSLSDPTNGGLQPSSHPIVGGGLDQDWRAQALFPVEWVSFQAVWEGDNGSLSWETALEINASYFEVQRKIENQGLFERLGTVSASGNSTQVQSYQFLDDQLTGIAKGDKVFYRLKQVDIDGKFEYSSIVELHTGSQLLSFRMYPNPTEDLVTVEVLRGQSQLNMQIINLDGKIVHRKSLSGQDQSIQLSLGHLAKGIYLVQLENEYYKATERLVIK